MIPISLRISVFPNRYQQFDLSLQSLTQQKYPSNQIELLVLIDAEDNQPILDLLKKYRPYFAKITLWCNTNGKLPVSHSAPRRNFLATQAEGEYIVFSEPEMYHRPNTIQGFLRHAMKHRKNEWTCGPVYAAEDVVNKDGSLSVDEVRQIPNLQMLLKTATKSLANFHTYYHLIDYRIYSTPFFCTMFHRQQFLKLKGLNQHLKVRGYEETEFFQRFSKHGGKIIIDDSIQTIHLPHPRIIDKETQIAWNLYNSTVRFDPRQTVGKISDASYTRIAL